MKKIFSFWNYLYINDSIDIKYIVSKWKECGTNVAMSFAYNPNKCKKERIIELLDECGRNDIKVIINDDRTSYLRLDEISREQFEIEVKQAYLDFGKHKATFGFYIGDEPNFEHIDNFIYTANLVQNIMPNLLPWGNLLPYWNDKEESEKYGLTEDFFFELVSRILKETNIKLIGFDHYTQCFDSYLDSKKGIEYFLYDIRNYRKVCNKFNIPFVVSLLSIGHWKYREPNCNDFRWQISTSLAHGADGIMWFYFHQNSLDTGYGNAPFIGENLIETPTYQYLKVEQRRVIENYFPLFDNLKFVSVRYLDENNGFDYEDDGISSFKMEREFLTFMSHFIDKTNNDRYLMITNGNQNLGNHFEFEINNKKEDFWLLPGEFKLIKLAKLNLEGGNI